MLLVPCVCNLHETYVILFRNRRRCTSMNNVIAIIVLGDILYGFNQIYSA